MGEVAHCREASVVLKERMFFFEKKNQKTFIRLHGVRKKHPAQRKESLFASFSSEKEESFFLSPS
jgi:RNase adaptor protein for sRNA GlmZ degradation